MYVVEVSGGRVMRAQVGQAPPRGRPGPRPRPRPRRERAAARAGRVRGADPGVRVCGGRPVPGALPVWCFSYTPTGGSQTVCKRDADCGRGRDAVRKALNPGRSPWVRGQVVVKEHQAARLACVIRQGWVRCMSGGRCLPAPFMFDAGRNSLKTIDVMNHPAGCASGRGSAHTAQQVLGL